MTTSHATLVWFRNDLRLDDHPALTAAMNRGGIVIPAFIYAPDEEGDWPIGAAARWWLHHSLHDLHCDLQAIGSQLVIRRGPAATALARLALDVGAEAVFFNRRYEPAGRQVDDSVEEALTAIGTTVRTFGGSLLREPWDSVKRDGSPYKVFTPFCRALIVALDGVETVAAPKSIPSPDRWPKSVAIDNLDLHPEHEWAGGLSQSWKPGSRGAMQRLERFVDESLGAYGTARDRPDHEGTSTLSPHLRFGEISPRRIWKLVGACAGDNERGRSAAEPYLRQLAWRDFAYHLLYHFPGCAEDPLQEAFAAFPWGDDPVPLRAWERGQTGYPFVDAGMRQLWRTGWMHNRVRMVVASFLTKHLLTSWHHGARWFWDTLVDADLANNTFGWQWTAGCGADAAPYFRVFNPVIQGRKFDPDGVYVRQWVPELSALPDRWIHCPWDAPADLLEGAGVILGADYPRPIVDHAEARRAALSAYESTKNRRVGTA